MSRLIIEIPEELKRDLKVVCASKGITIKDFVAELIKKALAKKS